MKHLNIPYIILALLINFSCTNESTEYATPNYLIGSWEILEEGQLVDNGIVEYEFVANECEIPTIAFMENNMFVNKNYSILVNDCDAPILEAIYSVNSRNIELTPIGTQNLPFKSFTVLSLTFKNLEVCFKSLGSSRLHFLKLKKI